MEPVRKIQFTIPPFKNYQEYCLQRTCYLLHLTYSTAFCLQPCNHSMFSNMQQTTTNSHHYPQQQQQHWTTTTTTTTTTRIAACAHFLKTAVIDSIFVHMSHCARQLHRIRIYDEETSTPFDLELLVRLGGCDGMDWSSKPGGVAA